MGSTWRIATIFGIPIRLHWTLGLFFLFFIWLAFREALSIPSVSLLLGFIISLYICILLHEFGHSLTAKRYGVKTRDIILSPIGGLARLESIPENPFQEFKVAINGPLVNLAIASILAAILYISEMPFIVEIINGVVRIDSSNFLQWLMYMNVGVFLFNLIPAFPMDGGRILRSLLSLKMNRTRATFWASILGKFFAVGFVVYALYAGYFMLIIIGPFIYLMAGQEYRQVKLSEIMKATQLSSIVRSPFTKVYQEDEISNFIKMASKSEEASFLVYDKEENITGSLPELFVEEILKNPNNYMQIKDIKSENFKILDASANIDHAFKIMKEEGLAIVGILDKEKVVGVVDRTTISKFIFNNSKRGFF